MYDKFNEEFESFYPRLLNRLPAQAIARNTSFKMGVKDTLANSMAHKVKLAQALGMPADLRIKFDTMNPKLIEQHASFKILKDGLSRLDIPLVDDKGRNLLQMVMDNTVTIGKRDNRFTRYYMPHLILMTGTDWQGHFSRLGEVIAQQKKDAYISANPMDLMFSTEESGYTSCYRLQGPHGAGNLAYANDAFTAMTFIKSGDQKIARAFAYFNTANYKDFVLGKVYGQEAEPTAKLLSTCIISQLGNPVGNTTWGEEIGRDYLRNIASHHNPDHRRYVGFFDKMISARFTITGSNRYWAMNFPLGRCLTCAKEIPVNKEHSHSCDSCEAKFKPITCVYCRTTSSDADKFRQDIVHPTHRSCLTCYADKYHACTTCAVVGAKANYYQGNCALCVAKLYVNDYKGTRILRDTAAQVFNITGRQVYCSKSKNGSIPKGLYKTIEEAAAAQNLEKAKRRAMLKNTQDSLGKIQYEFESEVQGKFTVNEDLLVYNQMLAELIAMDNQ